MDILETIFRIGFWLCIVLWALILLPSVWLRYRRFQRELHGLVIPACHLPPKDDKK